MTITSYSSSLRHEKDLSILTASDKDEMTAESNSLDIQISCLDSSLEGVLFIRKGRSSGHNTWSWKRRYITYRFGNGGSISAYKTSDTSKFSFESGHVGVTPSITSMTNHDRPYRNNVQSADNLDIDIAPDLPWLAKDVEKDPSTFVIEIRTDISNENAPSGHTVDSASSSKLQDDGFESDDDDHDDFQTLNGDGSLDEKNTISMKQDNLLEELNTARKKGKPLRIYFRCDGGLDEKYLWLRAFSKFGRLSDDIRRKKSLFSSFASSVLSGSSMIRNVAQESTFSKIPVAPSSLVRTSEIQSRGGRVTLKDKEFRILPAYAYPQCWLTKSQMREEMLLPSDYFHDLRVPGCVDKEIGNLEVEVLQCIGLPKMDRGSDTDAVVYLVCGSYAFSTDIIFNRVNPMWLRKTRRACVFPLFHGYARLYVGVFDHERNVKDDFAGRVIIDLARLRPRSTYDVTLPLRLSTHVYSRRRRGAVRLRFTLNWTSERDALLSYIPKSLKIPLPQHSKPNFDTTVMCNDQKAFRNIAITVHGAHLPRRFTFNQMRAAIREINFTRKYIFTVMRRVVRETMQWKNPAISGFVFLSWMHCVFANAFSLVPFYLIMYFLLFLMRNYAIYCTDAPSQRGFIPPSWEELFFVLIRGGDSAKSLIEPLELGVRQPSLMRRKSPESTARLPSNDYSLSQYSVATHKPRGKKLMQALGFLPDINKNPNDDHIEFPFADGKDYPKFSVKECLVTHGKQNSLTIVGSSDLLDWGSTTGSAVNDADLHRNGVIPRFPIDMDLQRLMRKDSSGTKDYDEEENNFNASRAVMSQGRKAASKVTKTATALSSKTGLDYVVRPIQSGISSGVGHVSSSVGHMSTVAGTVTSHVMSMPSNRRRRSGITSNSYMAFSGDGDRDSFDESYADAEYYSSDDSVGVSKFKQSRVNSDLLNFSEETKHLEFNNQISQQNHANEIDIGLSNSFQSQSDKIDPDLAFPEQDIDIQGPSSGKKIPDDLAEIKDKMHELTWHLFDDHAYVVKNPNAVFFGETQKPEKRRKNDPNKQIDKYLHIGQYSHPNPFVARVGTYVEPIIGSSYSLLCLFRAGFNVVTWRDPMLTFWLSFACGILAIILWFFPWRIFLFCIGIWLVGPQNWAFRILCEQGFISSNSRKKPSNTHIDKVVNYDTVPTTQPVFTMDSRKQGNEVRRYNPSSLNPREIHHVVIPYGPLMYQRCNDWPPEPEYAQVRRKLSDDSKTQDISEPYQAFQIRRHNSIVNGDHIEIGIFGRIRRRFRRVGPSHDVQGLPPLDPNRNRAASRD